MLHVSDPFEDITARPVSERGPWMATSTGGMWSIHHPAPRDVSIRDLAAGLSRNCRYNGQIVEDCDFLAVAEHSVLMTRWAVKNGATRTREDALAILLHDASEAYYGDMVTPLKELIPDFRSIENKAQAVIIEAFGLSEQNTGLRKEDIKLIDRRIRIDEREVAIAEPARSAGREIVWDDETSLGGLGIEVKGLNSREARQQFLEEFIWCVDHLPARDPAITPLLQAHASEARDLLAHIETRKSAPSVPHL